MNTPNATVTAKTTADLVAIAERRIGYAPIGSLLLACTNEQAHLLMVARVDLCDLAGPRGEDTAREVRGVLARVGACWVQPIAYTDHPAQAQAAAARLDWHDQAPVIQVTSTGWGHVEARETALSEIASSDAARALEQRGDVLADGPAGLLPAPAPTEQREATARCLAAAHEPSLREGVRAWTRPYGTMTPEEAAFLITALNDRRTRDAVIVSMTPGAEGVDPDFLPACTEGAMAEILGNGGTQPGEQARLVLATAAQVLRMTTDSPAAVPTLTLWVLITWWSGDATRAGVGAARALTLDPGYRLAQLIQQTIGCGLGPGWTRNH